MSPGDCALPRRGQHQRVLWLFLTQLRGTMETLPYIPLGHPPGPRQELQGEGACRGGQTTRREHSTSRFLPNRKEGNSQGAHPSPGKCAERTPDLEVSALHLETTSEPHRPPRSSGRGRNTGSPSPLVLAQGSSQSVRGPRSSLGAGAAQTDPRAKGRSGSRKVKGKGLCRPGSPSTRRPHPPAGEGARARVRGDGGEGRGCCAGPLPRPGGRGPPPGSPWRGQAPG